MSRAPRRPRDLNQLAKLIVDISTGEQQDVSSESGKDPAAIERGRKGGLKGGKRRASALSPARRAQIARKAASARWSKK